MKILIGFDNNEMTTFVEHQNFGKKIFHVEINLLKGHTQNIVEFIIATAIMLS